MDICIVILVVRLELGLISDSIVYETSTENILSL